MDNDGDLDFYLGNHADKFFVDVNVPFTRNLGMDIHSQQHMFRNDGGKYTDISEEAGMKATVKYKISLLNGRVCYTSDNKGLEQFVVDNDQVESGLHEGIKRMKVGNKAKFILPSHLAHGLIGDEDKIPSHAPIVYDIELLELNK
jgi:FKBP-type peptidyl-prolyl cis-trans isomerase